MEITIGMRGEASLRVTEQDTALALGSGSLPVLATPRMVALMEEAACAAIAPALGEGQTSVGTALTIAHSAATPVGMDVRAVAEVTAVNGRAISFQVTAYDTVGEIGSGTHERFLVMAERFTEKAYGKLDSHDSKHKAKEA